MNVIIFAPFSVKIRIFEAMIIINIILSVFAPNLSPLENVHIFIITKICYKYLYLYHREMYNIEIDRRIFCFICNVMQSVFVFSYIFTFDFREKVLSPTKLTVRAVTF